MENQMIIKKVPLEEFLSILEMLYERGVDYIDLTFEKMENKDKIGIHYSDEYISKEFKEQNRSEESSNNSSVEIKLSDEDLNNMC